MADPKKDRAATVALATSTPLPVRKTKKSAREEVEKVPLWATPRLRSTDAEVVIHFPKPVAPVKRASKTTEVPAVETGAPAGPPTLSPDYALAQDTTAHGADSTMDVPPTPCQPPPEAAGGDTFDVASGRKRLRSSTSSPPLSDSVFNNTTTNSAMESDQGFDLSAAGFGLFPDVPLLQLDAKAT